MKEQHAPVHPSPELRLDIDMPNIAQRPKGWRHYALCYSMALLLGIVIGISLVAITGTMVDSIRGAAAAPEQTDPLREKSEALIVNATTGELRCADDWQTAKRMGCIYDVMASRWYPPKCYDPIVLGEMLSEMDFEWYEDIHHTNRSTWDRAISGEFENLYPLEDYHVMHCLYLWRKLHSAIIHHRHIDRDIYDYEHTLHCTRLILDWPRYLREGDSRTTAALTLKPDCMEHPL